MKASIGYVESISHQDSFQKENIWDHLLPLESNSQVIAPDYKNYIPAASLRRFSPVLRMSLTAAQEVAQKAGEAFDSISVGTSLGCLKDTEKFLQTFITSTGDTLSPTAFIQSTHNTIAGAISMALSNHCYNMTHTQNSLSFETALIDGLLCIGDGKKNVLVGAADEAIDFLELLKPVVIQDEAPFTSSCTFFNLMPHTPEKKGIIDCELFFNNQDTATSIENFLNKNGISPAAIELVLHSGDALPSIDAKQVNYEQYTGLFYTSAAFAVHMAIDFPLQATKYILIVNQQVAGKLALTLIG